eukprot:TRINITY_DN3358_c0_g1_i16.p1 TRINITY_DN3358_c0_g1~~TRINITY_DN3358_c0_g1_i16.p1  ORF type:complete len:443 (+),score=17.61 TRINITY_DN3358_c0_g1_i16:397-1725(+)
MSFGALRKLSQLGLYFLNVAGTLFQSQLSTMSSDMANWHLDSLQTPLNQFDICGEGISRPMLYVSTGKGSVFAWHVEDIRLCSVSYNHSGACKEWFVVPPSKAQAFAQLAAKLFPKEARKCSQFVQHKMCLIEPEYLASQGIEVCSAMHKPGQFMIVLPNAYHSGINHGANISESVNFSHRTWLLSEQELGKPDFCECNQTAPVADGTSRAEHLMRIRDMLMQLHRRVRSRFTAPDHVLLSWHSTVHGQTASPSSPKKRPSPSAPPGERSHAKLFKREEPPDAQAAAACPLPESKTEERHECGLVTKPLLPGRCDLCRERHKKCDGDGHNPCSRCTQRNVECKYLNKRKPGPRHVASPVADGSSGEGEEPKRSDVQPVADGSLHEGEEQERSDVQRVADGSLCEGPLKCHMHVDAPVNCSAPAPINSTALGPSPEQPQNWPE